MEAGSQAGRRRAGRSRGMAVVKKQCGIWAESLAREPQGTLGAEPLIDRVWCGYEGMQR